MEKALEVDQGFYTYSLTGGTYTGDDLPHGNYAFGPASIYKRNGNSITVVLYGVNADYTMKINHYNGERWLGWESFVTDKNLMSSLKIVDVSKTPMSSIYDSLPQFSIDIKYVIECGDAPVSNDGLCITFKRIQIYGWQIFLVNNIESNKAIFIRNWYGQNNPGGWKKILLT